jgi:hypothetical protein
VGPCVEVGELPAGEPVDPTGGVGVVVELLGPVGLLVLGGIGFALGVVVGAFGAAGVGAGVLGFVGVLVGAVPG